MARILFLSHRIPYPPNKGDKIRSWHFLEHLLERHQVHAGFFVDDKDDLQHIAYLEERCESLVYQYTSPFLQKVSALRGLINGGSLTENAYPSGMFRRRIASLIENGGIDLVFCYSAASFSFLPATPYGLPVITDLVDVDSAKWAAYAFEASGLKKLLYSREAAKLSLYENRVARSSKVTLLVSDDEARLMRARMPPEEADECLIAGIANGVDAERFSPARYPAPREGRRLIFTGAMDYQPNIDAVVWFTKKIFRKLKARFPDTEFVIAGRPVASKVQQLDADDGVRVIGAVEDMAAEIAKAQVVVAPLRTARGIQNKVLEGMAMAKPVVATPAANEGINAPDGQAIVLADDPNSFCDAVGALLSPDMEAKTLGYNARQYVLENFSWQASLNSLDRVIDPVLHNRVTPDSQS